MQQQPRFGGAVFVVIGYGCLGYFQLFSETVNNVCCALESGLRVHELLSFKQSARGLLAYMSNPTKYPDAVNESLVGTYPALARSGGGYVWDDVLEYRVWCNPSRGAADIENGSDYYYAFASYAEALEFSQKTEGADEPIALIMQNEYIDEPIPGQYVHVKEERVTEWPVTFLSRPRRTERTIPDFMSPDAPSNRLDILRGISK